MNRILKISKPAQAEILKYIKKNIDCSGYGIRTSLDNLFDIFLKEKSYKLGKNLSMVEIFSDWLAGWQTCTSFDFYPAKQGKLVKKWGIEIKNDNVYELFYGAISKVFLQQISIQKKQKAFENDSK